jgi:uncharacterized protein
MEIKPVVVADIALINKTISRRRVLQVMGLGLIPAKLRTAVANSGYDSALLSSVMDASGQHWWLASTAAGQPVWRTPLPSRGHGMAVSPLGEQAVMVGRRPGGWMLVASWQQQSEQREVEFRQLDAARNRHYFGHAQYSADGRLLFATENDFRHGRGVVGIYETDTFTRLGEWFSGGIGPHELKMMGDGVHVAIANGGILTHPERPREKLNIDTMEPNLSIININTGSVAAQYQLSDLQMSIRHLDITSSGQIWVGCQYEGNSLEPLPLVAHTTTGKGLQWAQDEQSNDSEPVDYASGNSTGANSESSASGKGADNVQDLVESNTGKGAMEAIKHVAVWRQLNRYCGSVCCHPDYPVTAVSSPRGDHVLLWDSVHGAYLRSFRLRDVCGIVADLRAVQHAGFIVSTGKGELWRLSVAEADPTPLQVIAGNWDNHLAQIPFG